MTNRRQFLALTSGFAAATLAATTIPAFAGSKTRSGNFSGRSDHITTGKTELSGNSVVLASDFSLDGAPDPRVGLGKNGKFDPSTDLGALKKLTGKQSYKVGNGINTSDYNEVYIWCRKFNVPLGVAKLGN